MSTPSYSAYTRNWLSQFGLYKYESAEPLPPKKRNLIGVYFATGMLFIIAFTIFLILINNTTTPILVESIIVTDSPSNDSQQDQLDQYSASTLDNLEDSTESSHYMSDHIVLTTEYYKNHKPYSEVHRNIAASARKGRHYDFSRNSGGWYPNRTEYLLERENLRPPNRLSARPVKVKNPMVNTRWNEVNGITVASGIRDQIPRPPSLKGNVARRHYSDSDEPRPFNYLLDGPPPSEFQKTNLTGLTLPDIPYNNTGQVNNIQDILHQMRGSETNAKGEGSHNFNLNGNSGSGIQIAGTYRHAKGNDISRIFDTMVQKYTQSPRTKTPKANPIKIHEDPFYTYKPNSPSEINLLALNQFRFAPPMISPKPNSNPQFVFPQQYHQQQQPHPTTEAESIYQRVIAANKNRNKKHQTIRKSHESKKNQPFSLMLDIYPMGEEEQTAAVTPTHRPYKTKFRKPAYLPLPPGPNAVNNLPYSFQLDNSYYHAINFPQVQPNKHPKTNSFHQNSYIPSVPNVHHSPHVPNGPYHNQMTGYHHRGYTPTSNEYETNKPSQIMVQLNLFPKKKGQEQQYEQQTQQYYPNHQYQQHRPTGYEVLTPGYEADKRNSKSDTNYNFRPSNWSVTVEPRLDLNVPEEPTQNPNQMTSEFEHPIVVLTHKSAPHDREGRNFHFPRTTVLPIDRRVDPTTVPPTIPINFTGDQSRRSTETVLTTAGGEIFKNFKLPEDSIIKFGYNDAIPVSRLN